MSTPNTEPTIITAGDTVRWSKDLASYPADAYALKYTLQPIAGGSPITVTATPAGTGFAITISAETSADFFPGDYRWFSTATDLATGTERYTIDGGSLTVNPDPATLTATSDLRSHARKVLTAIEAVLEGTATSDHLSYTVDGRSLQRRTIAELLQLRSFYQQEIRREEQAEALARGLGGGNRILTRFV